jgi:tRNA-splicing ligase RtcB
MHKVNNKLMSWASIIEPETLAQAERTARLDFVQPHVALMPDAHLGAGATVGSVIPTVAAIIPAAVGVDIGCGMIAVRTQFVRSDLTGDLSRLRHDIERNVPSSAGSNNRRLTDTAAVRVRELENLASTPDRYDKLAKNWRLQLGSLGSGNHFIEVSVDETDAVWLFLHSGSRGIGNKIARHHIKRAQHYCGRLSARLEDTDLAHLAEGTPEFDAYITDLNWAQRFALLNREEMMDRVIVSLNRFMGGPVEQQERINCHHNFTQREYHHGRDVWLSRKGAMSAHQGQVGLIPGSMGTASYVVEGLGNAQSFCSAPHGAGRAYSRHAARRLFSREHLRDAMRGIEYRDTEAFLDEIPAAYKDVDQVIRDSADLVRVKHTLHQLVNVKGD